MLFNNRTHLNISTMRWARKYRTGIGIYTQTHVFTLPNQRPLERAKRGIPPNLSRGILSLILILENAGKTSK